MPPPRSDHAEWPKNKHEQAPPQIGNAICGLQSSGHRIPPAPKRTSFADQLKAQSEIWKAQVKDYQGRVEQAGEQARGEYKKSMEQMQDKAEEARNLAEKVRDAKEEAWKDMVGASQKAFVELQRGWAHAVSRFQ